MPKKKHEPVSFRVFDGLKPNRVGPARVFNLKAPITLNIPPGASVTVSLGLACNYPLHIFQTRSMIGRGLELSPASGTVDADLDLVLQIRNTNREMQLVEQGDVLARAAAVDNVELEQE